MENPTLHLLPIDGQQLAVWEWAGRNPPILFAHATGFHGRCWDEVARQIPDRRRIAVDFRGHGRSSKPDPPYPWRRFGLDLAAVAQLLGVEDAIGVGHSMGGHAAVAATAVNPRLYTSLLLIDPTIFPPERYGTPPFDTAFILRRRNEWNSPEEMFESYRDRPPFQRWHPQVLRDYCDFGLLPIGDKFVLACPPQIEASIYPLSVSPESNLYPDITSIDQPVVIMRAGITQTPGVFDLSASPSAPDLATKFRRGRDMLLPGRNHFIPMETPDLVAGVMREHFAAAAI